MFYSPLLNTGVFLRLFAKSRKCEVRFAPCRNWEENSVSKIRVLVSHSISFFAEYVVQSLLFRKKKNLLLKYLSFFSPAKIEQLANMVSKGDYFKDRSGVFEIVLMSCQAFSLKQERCHSSGVQLRLCPGSPNLIGMFF